MPQCGSYWHMLAFYFLLFSFFFKNYFLKCAFMHLLVTLLIFKYYLFPQ